MAYDPKDPADKKIMDDAIAAALAEAAEEHESNIAGLKNKNKELLAKLKAAGSEDTAKIEAELEKIQTELKEAQKALKTVTKERDTFKASAESETNFNRKLLIDNGLTDELVKAGVAKQFLPAAKALLSPQVQVVAEGDNRIAKVGDKSLSDFIKEWSQGEDGKHYVAAPGNAGGNGNGNTNTNQNTKTMTRTAFEALSPADKMAQSKEGVTLTD